MIESGSIYQEESDLRELIRVLLKRWYLLLLFTIMGGVAVLIFGVMNKPIPTFTATAVIQMSDPNLTEIILDNKNKDLVIERLGIDSNSVITPTLVQQTNDKSLYNLIIQSGDKEKAKIQVNTWADIVIESIRNTIVEGSTGAIERAQSNVELADSNFSKYLENNGLGSLTWYELVNITGIVTSEQLICNNYSIDQAPNTPSVSSYQRSKLDELMREKIAAEQAYQNVATANLKIILELDDKDYFVVSYASSSIEATNKPFSIKNVLVGGLFGAIFSIIGILVIYWWRDTNK